MKFFIVTIIIFGIWIIPTHLKQRVAQADAASASQKPKEAKKNQGSSDSKVIQGLIQEIEIKNQIEAQAYRDQENHANEDRQIQWKIVKYTRVLTLASVFQALILLGTLIVIYPLLSKLAENRSPTSPE